LRIDDVDRQIVAELTRDARQSYALIGLRVGLSAPAVKRRVDRLRRDGVIIRFSAVLSADLAGTMEAFVEVFCHEPIAPERIMRVLERYPEVVAAYLVSGEPDALVHLRTGNVMTLDDVLERIRQDLRAERTRSSIVLARLFERDPQVG
jgi:DNA-binding Lrp family transcriptional regulator